MTDQDRALREEHRTADHYRTLWHTHGDSHRALDWGSRESQIRRFAVLMDDMPLHGCRLLDVGCGLAHLADWLEQEGHVLEYTGLDLMPEFLAHASRRHPTRRFITGSVLDPQILADARFDVVVSSGLFYSYPEGGNSWMQAVVNRMWQWTDGALAFNALSTWAPMQEPNESYADPLEVLRHCATLTSRLELRHDYHPRDFTVRLWRTRQGGSE
ncbi:class I SAM-dependent methyltransferase [Gemmatimonas sp.]|uniref:class I SAM-dependent methyltransferase n=1 Tax=Gemmatimonas sp. TaxID=1962908 RepID=UPI00286A2CC7|nr:class I SAM-dependent methyltransferase [Gemmatimonas sp.]